MKKYLFLAVAALAFTACSNDDDSNANDGPVAVQINAGVGESLTRASNSSWDAGDKIGIYMYNAGTSTIAEEVENIPYTTTDGTSIFTPVSSTIYFPVDGSNVDFTAWYPYEDVDGGEWTADLTDQSSQEAIDLMAAEAKSGTIAYNKNQPAVSLSFQHMLTKLVVNIKAGEGISTADLAGLTVQITEQVSTVIYDPEFSISAGYVQQLATINLLTTDDGTFAEAILCPDDVATAYSLDRGRQLVFTLADTGDSFTYDIAADKSFNTGEKNIYNITINRAGLEVTATIEDWIDGNNGGEDGSAE